MTSNFSVIGAGNGGKTMAAHLGLMGFSVTLYNRSPERVAIIKKRGGIELESEDEGGPHGFSKITRVTSDIGEALKDSDVIMVVIPSSAHAAIAKACAEHLRDGHI
ncbi:MAG TPA: NAD(P)-binding domain-containing protein, partial [Anaerolineales bacterium]|nr:NAD(P)-binding domain-containing protein [Anaerolineales bacterium]